MTGEPMTGEPMTGEPRVEALRFEAVTRVHGQGAATVRALGPVAFAVAPGEFVAVMGPSGSGKSTLLTLAGALDRPTGGTVRVDGIDLADLGPRELARLRRRVIGYVFQELNLLPGLTALENVALPLELDGVPIAEARDEARRALDGVQMERFADRFPENLSGGEQQRVAIARAFVGPRSLLLADEPTGALDQATGAEIMALFQSLNDEGRTVVLVTHDRGVADHAKRRIAFCDGHVLEDSAA
jgi:putative ABC transport system ATP-binding protein